MAKHSSFVCQTQTEQNEKSLATHEKLSSWLNVSLNVAVTGGSGKGKPSLINAMLNLKEDDEGAAFSDTKEATRIIKKI
jgi:predicted GTPase